MNNIRLIRKTTALFGGTPPPRKTINAKKREIKLAYKRQDFNRKEEKRLEKIVNRIKGELK